MSDYETLYGWVRDLPIVDWHNHLDMAMLAEDKPLGSLYEVWVKSDPYKHRAMRICGEPEELITGTGTTGVPPVGRERGASECNGQDARCPSEETAKWAAWMRTLPKLVGNPLFTWAKMELEWLGLDPLPYLHGTGENISLSNWTPSKILKRFNVEYLSPCVTGTTGILPVALGQRASRPLQWTAVDVKEFPSAQSTVSSHFSHTLSSGSFHKRNLPHVGQQSSLVFVTFRLGDSLPQSSLDELEEYKREWLLNHPEPWSGEVCHEWKAQLSGKIDKWLDAGHGSCLLADPCLRKVVEDSLEFFNATGTTGVPPVGECGAGTTGVSPVGNRKGNPFPVNGQDARCPSAAVNGQDARCPSGRGRYRLHAYIVMPNHVHVLFELFDAKDLSAIIHSWKSFTAKKLNEITGGKGKVWKEEYYDRLIRNAEHYVNTLAYIRKNGAAAKALANVNGQDARCPSGGAVVNGQDARCPSVVPSLRMNVDDEVSVETLEKFRAAGCRIVDVSVDDVSQLTTYNSQLSTVAAYAAAHGWTMLLHLGALRETSARLRAVAGPTGGFAGMRAPVDPAAIAAFLNALDTGTTGVPPVGGEGGTGTTGVPPVGGEGNPSLSNGQDARCPSRLPRTILMSLNPEAHAALAVLAGSFVEEGMPGKVQLGPAWWWCDHEEGIRDVLEKNAAYGVLSTFVGMTTDSRSLLSFVRHDYFRRVLCKWVAEKVASGAFPDDESLLRPLLENICYNNAKGMLS